MAIAGFVCAFVCGLVGVILSAIAMSQIGKSNGRLTGKGLAIAGLVISIVSTVWMVGVLSAVAIPAFMEYMNKSRGSEGQIQLNRLGKAAKATYSSGYSTLPAVITPSTNACAVATTKKFAKGSWPVLAAGTPVTLWDFYEFSIDDAFQFNYGVSSGNTTTNFTAYAIADLNCNLGTGSLSAPAADTATADTTTYFLTGGVDNSNPSLSTITKMGKD